MKLTLFIHLFALLFICSASSAHSLDWVKNIGGKAYERALAVTTDQAGSVYVTGYFADTADFDPGPDTILRNAIHGNRIFLVKLDKHGHFKWVRIYGSSSIYNHYTEKGTDLACDSFGHVYLTGEFRNKVYFVHNSKQRVMLKTNGSDDAFILKLDTAGNFKWVKQFEGTGDGTSKAIAVDQSGNIYHSGSFKFNVDLDPGSDTFIIRTPYHPYYSYICKLDSSGGFKWGFSYKNIDINDITCQQNGDLIVAGSFSGWNDFDPDSSNSHQLYGKGVYRDGYIAKFSVKGQLKWVKQFSGNGASNVAAIYSKDNHIFCSGTFTDTFDIDPDTTQTYFVYDSLKPQTRNVFVSKFDMDGNFLWVGHSWNGYSAHAHDITVTTDGSVFATGRIEGSLSFGPYSHEFRVFAKHKRDMFLCKYDSIGKLIWAKGYNGYWELEGASLASDPFNNCIATGHFTDTADFDPSPNVHMLRAHRYEDVFILKLSDCGMSKATKSLYACQPRKSPGLGYTWDKSGNYHELFRSKNGCDSIVTFNFSLAVNYDTISVESCDSFTLPGSKRTVYQSGSYMETFTNYLGCDSLLTIDLSLHKSYLKTMQLSSCQPLLTPSKRLLMDTSGNYLDTLSSVSGCDSVLSINFNLHTATFSNLNISDCQEYISPSGKFKYHKTGTYYDTITNNNGCDSFITVNFNKLESSTSQLSITGCNSYTSPSGNHTFRTSGNYFDTIPNTDGCDSIISIQLTIVNTLVDSLGYSSASRSGSTLMADSVGLTYQWLDCEANYAKIDSATSRTYQPNKTGKYAVEVAKLGCADTSTCLAITLVNQNSNIQHILHVFPNPTQKRITFSHEGKEMLEVDIYNSNGIRVRHATSIRNSSTSIDTEDLMPGIYSALVRFENGSGKVSFIKQ